MGRKTKKYIGALEIALRINLENAETLDYDHLYAILLYNGYRYNSAIELWAHNGNGHMVAKNPHVIIRISCHRQAVSAEVAAMRNLLLLGDYEIISESKSRPFKDNPDMLAVFFEVWRDNDNDLHLAANDLR